MSRGYPVASYLPQTDPPTADAECAPSPYATRITDELYARWLELKKRKFTRGATMQELGISKHDYRCCSARYRQEVLMKPQVLPKPAPSKDLARFDPFYFR
jgi:hypothetical protein